MRAATLSIGDEFISGQKLDRHGAWLADRLAAAGVVVVEHRIVPDDRDAVADAIGALAARSDVLVITGGLGPTLDDVTREALGDVAMPGRPLVVDAAAERALHAFFKRRGRAPSASNLRQALRPESATSIPNPNGTAPGLSVTIGACRAFALPGPPREMYPMFERVVAPSLGATEGEVVRTGTVACFGLPESVAADRLGDLLARRREPMVGITVSEAIITARVRAIGVAVDAARAVAETADRIETLWAPYAYGRGETTLAGAVVQALVASGRTIATAESCTGGLLGAMLVDVAGSSEVYAGGWVTYSDAMKTACLGVPREMLDAHGAVSEPVACAMATGAMRNAGTTTGVGITGIAGPGGAVPGKPVGTVFIAAASGDVSAPVIDVRRFEFSGDRQEVRERAAKSALQMIRFAASGVESAPMTWEVVADPSKALR